MRSTQAHNRFVLMDGSRSGKTVCAFRLLPEASTLRAVPYLCSKSAALEPGTIKLKVILFARNYIQFRERVMEPG